MTKPSRGGAREEQREQRPERLEVKDKEDQTGDERCEIKELFHY